MKLFEIHLWLVPLEELVLYSVLILQVAQATKFYTTLEQLFINNISSLLPTIYLDNTSEYQGMNFPMLHEIYVFNIFVFCIFLCVSYFLKSLAPQNCSLCITDTEKCISGGM